MTSAGGPGPASPRFCTSCGAPATGGAFCVGCGAPQAPAAPPLPPPPLLSPPSAGAEPAAPWAGLGPAQPAAPGRGRRRAILGSVLAVLLIAGGVGGFVLLRDDEEGERADRTVAAEPSPTPEDEPEPEPEPEPVGTLRIGSLLPETGNLAFLGPPGFAGVDLAVRDINAAGGIFGEDVEHVRGDSGDMSTDIAGTTVSTLLGSDVSVIVGALSSGVSFSVIDQITAAGVLQYSPANTSPELTSYSDGGLYFRTSPSDDLQGQALAGTIVADGRRKVAILAIDDPYGTALSGSIAGTLTRKGAAVAGGSAIVYDPTQDLRSEARQVAALAPDAVVIVGFEETATAVEALIEAGVGPQSTPLYLVDGNLGNALGEDLPTGSLAGVQGILPGAQASDDLRQRLLQVDPALSDFSYAAESYDAVVTAALAAIAAQSVDGADLAAELPDVTKGGTRCATFAACRDLLVDGEDIDYDGESGPITLSRAGDPTQAEFGIYTYGSDNRLRDDVEYVQTTLE